MEISSVKLLLSELSLTLSFVSAGSEFLSLEN